VWGLWRKAAVMGNAHS